MELSIYTDAEELAIHTSDLIVAAINTKPDLVLCLPTGRTPRRIYDHLVANYRREQVSFARAKVFNLDEYVGLSGSDPGSFSAYMRASLVDQVDIPRGRWHIPDGRADDLEYEAAAYDHAIAQAGLDLVVLGVGSNGHIGFNEPGSPRDSRTRVVDLAAATLAANALDFPQNTRIRQGITIGIANILEARRIVLLATGAAKAQAISQLLEGGDPDVWPVAAIRGHPNCAVLVDQAAMTPV